jgi:cytochrome c-type biogenesis protein
MSEWLQAFLIGNSAILTNVCILPLYPGLIAFLAGNAGNTKMAIGWLGVLVLAGILSLMLGIGALLFALQQTFSAILPLLLPIIYGVVILLGVLMLAGYNPFKRLSSSQAPLLRNPYAAAYLYGLLIGPMTLPCAGPLVISAFLIGSGSFSRLADGLLYFLFFGLGFGWPLLLLPLIAQPMQRRFTRWMTSNSGALTRFSGVLLIAIGIWGIINDLLPNYH